MSRKRNQNSRQINIVKVTEHQDSTDPDMSNYDRLKEDYKSKQDTVDESSTMIENRTFEIASGGLVLSLTVLSFLDTHNRLPDGWSWMSIVIWSFFTLCIILHYWSHYASKRSAERTRDQIGKMISQGEEYNAQRINEVAYKDGKCLRVINFLTPLFLMLGVVGLVVFTSVCILIH